VAHQAQALLPDARAHKIRDRGRAVQRRILAIGKVLRRRTGAAAAHVRTIAGDLAPSGVAQIRAVRRVAVAGEAAVATAGDAVFRLSTILT
jgi:hypothetical protein